MKRVTKVITVFVISISVILCNSFSVFAYRPVVSIPSAAWDVASDGTYKNVYPDAAPPLKDFNDIVFQHSEYNGETYFTSNFWDDNYKKLTSLDFNFPAFPNADFEHYIVIRVRDVYYLIQDFSSDVSFYTDGLDLYYYTDSEEVFYIYRLSYPFSEWVLYDSVLAFDTGVYTRVRISMLRNETEFIYNSVDIFDYNFKSVILYSPDTFVLQQQQHTIEFYQPISVLKGTLSYALSGDVLNELVVGDLALKLSDLGFIVGTNTDYVYVSISGGFYRSTTHDFAGSFILSEHVVYGYDGSVDADYPMLEAGYAQPPYSEISKINLENLSFDGFILVLNYVFVSTGYTLFFPGNMEFIKLDDYEEEEHHNELIGSLNTISGTLTDLNNNMPSAIKQELEPIYADIKKDLSFIINGDTGVPDVNFNTSDLDNAVDDQDRIISGVYDDVDTLTNDMLQRFGYSSMDEFLQDNMNDLNDTNMLASFDFVKMLFEKVVSASGISILMLFSLTFAFAIYILGRRLS